MGEEIKEGILVLVRHGESQWNAIHQWTGLTDIGLSQKGESEAHHVATGLSGIPFDYSFTSRLCRASDTLDIILKDLHLPAVPVRKDAALNERDYGIYTGKNKLQIQQQMGDVAYVALRRGWDTPVPNGESLKQVFERVIPFYLHDILPLVVSGKKVLVVAHGNSLRALIKYIEHVKDEDIANVELTTGEVVVYRMNQDGSVASKEKRVV